jgi:hypothetical protein
MPYHSPEPMSGLEEEVGYTTITVARLNVGGAMKEMSKENSAAESCDVKKLLEYLIK